MDCIDVLEMEVNINKLIEMKVVIIKEQRAANICLIGGDTVIMYVSGRM